MRKIILVLTLIAISSVITFGQNDDYKKGEVFVGFSHSRVDSGIEPGLIPGDPIKKREGFNGFEASGVYNVSRYFGVKADVSGTYRNDNFNITVPTGPGTVATSNFESKRSVYNVLGGVQFKDNSPETKVKPFAHTLVGVGINRIKGNAFICDPNCDGINGLDGNESGLAGAFGGGLDIRINKRIDFRAFQVDYNPIRLDGATQHNVRFGIGIVFK